MPHTNQNSNVTTTQPKVQPWKDFIKIDETHVEHENIPNSGTAIRLIAELDDKDLGG
jgi:hypothetical protein